MTCTLVVACLFVSVAAPAQVVSITPGVPVRGEVTISSDPDSASFVTYSFSAARDVVAIDVELEAVADLDLYLDTQYIDDYQDVLAASTGYAGTESIRLDLSGDAELIGEEYFIDVAYGRLDPPVNSRGEVLRRIPYTLTVTTYRQRIDAELTPGTIIADRIDPRVSGPYRSFAIDVPNRTPALRVDLATDSTDLDLRVRYRNPMRTTRDADTVAVSWAGHETIVIESPTGEIPAGRYFIDVFDQAWLDWPADFRLVATLANVPPNDLVDLPTLSNRE